MPVTRTCPTCGKPVAAAGQSPAHPFCSDRCRLIDLGRWLGEEYRIPAGRPGDGAVGGPPTNPEDES